jgi:hypothetical protein
VTSIKKERKRKTNIDYISTEQNRKSDLIAIKGKYCFLELSVVCAHTCACVCARGGGGEHCITMEGIFISYLRLWSEKCGNIVND